VLHFNIEPGEPNNSNADEYLVVRQNIIGQVEIWKIGSKVTLDTSIYFSGYGRASISNNGQLAFLTNGVIQVYDTKTRKTISLVGDSLLDASPTISPNGEIVAYESMKKLHIYDLNTKVNSEFGDTVSSVDFDLGFIPMWSPDGNYIAYVRSSKLYIAAVNGKTIDSLYTLTNALQSKIFWAYNSKNILFYSSGSVSSDYSLYSIDISNKQVNNMFRSFEFYPSVVGDIDSFYSEYNVSKNSDKVNVQQTKEKNEGQNIVSYSYNNYLLDFNGNAVNKSVIYDNTPNLLYKDWINNEDKMYYLNENNIIIFDPRTNASSTYGLAQLGKNNFYSSFVIKYSNN